jgi:hypothetical protein
MLVAKTQGRRPHRTMFVERWGLRRDPSSPLDAGGFAGGFPPQLRASVAGWAQATLVFGWGSQVCFNWGGWVIAALRDAS